jgi:hypothetical protein
LFDLGIDVVVQRGLKTRVRGNLTFKDLSCDHKRAAGDADLYAVRCPAGVERRRDTDGTFTSDAPDLDHPSVLEYLEFGHDRSFRKENVVDPVVLLIQVLILCKIGAFQKLPETVQMLRPYLLEQGVTRRAGVPIKDYLVAVRSISDTSLMP